MSAENRPGKSLPNPIVPASADLSVATTLYHATKNRDFEFENSDFHKEIDDEATSRIKPGQSGIEYAGGTGPATRRLAMAGKINSASRLYIVDTNPRKLAIARRTFRSLVDAGVLTIIEGDVQETIPEIADNSQDFAFGLDFPHLLRRLTAFYTETNRVLKPEGEFEERIFYNPKYSTGEDSERAWTSPFSRGFKSLARKLDVPARAILKPDNPMLSAEDNFTALLQGGFLRPNITWWYQKVSLPYETFRDFHLTSSYIEGALRGLQPVAEGKRVLTQEEIDEIMPEFNDVAYDVMENVVTDVFDQYAVKDEETGERVVERNELRFRVIAA